MSPGDPRWELRASVRVLAVLWLAIMLAGIAERALSSILH